MSSHEEKHRGQTDTGMEGCTDLWGETLQASYQMQEQEMETLKATQQWGERLSQVLWAEAQQ